MKKHHRHTTVNFFNLSKTTNIGCIQKSNELNYKKSNKNKKSSIEKIKGILNKKCTYNPISPADCFKIKPTNKPIDESKIPLIQRKHKYKR